MKKLDRTIGLRMVGSGGLMSDVEEAAEVEPEGGSKLWSPVRGDDGWNAKPRDPGMDEGGSAIGGGGGREESSFRPSGGAVNDSEEVGITSRRGEGTD